MISLRALAIHSMEGAGFDPRRLVSGEVLDRFDVSIAATLDMPDDVIGEMRGVFAKMRQDGTVETILTAYGIGDG